MKFILEGEVSEIIKMLESIAVKNNTNKEKVTMSYNVSKIPLEFIFDEYKPRVQHKEVASHWSD